jgi:hypothetical protein
MRHIVSQVMPCTTIIMRHSTQIVSIMQTGQIRAAARRHNHRSTQQTINRNRQRSALGHKLSPTRKRPFPLEHVASRQGLVISNNLHSLTTVHTRPRLRSIRLQ